MMDGIHKQTLLPVSGAKWGVRRDTRVSLALIWSVWSEVQVATTFHLTCHCTFPCVTFHVRNLCMRTLVPWEAPHPQEIWGTWVLVVLWSVSCDLEQVTSPARLGLFTYKVKDCESLMPRCHRNWSQERELIKSGVTITRNLWLQAGQGLETGSSPSASPQSASLRPPRLSLPPELQMQLPLVQLCPHSNASLRQRVFWRWI